MEKNYINYTKKISITQQKTTYQVKQESTDYTQEYKKTNYHIKKNSTKHRNSNTNQQKQ